MGLKQLKYRTPEAGPQPRQASLLTDKVARFNPYPEILNHGLALDNLVYNTPGKIGLDLEGKDLGSGRFHPTILGLATETFCGAVRWDASLARAAISSGRPLVGHSFTNADRRALETELGVVIPLDQIEDTMIKHYLVNQDFCRAPGKGEDDDDPGALGLMNLWTMASLYTDLPQWKRCRGEACQGPCPQHDPLSYCAVDAWSGLMCDNVLDQEMTRKGIPRKFYRELIRLDDLCGKMQLNGVKVDLEYIARLEKDADRHKFELFPYQMKGKKRLYNTGSDTRLARLFEDDDPPLVAFNPASAPQVILYFRRHGIDLRTTEKKDIQKALEQVAKRTGASSLEDLETLPDLPTHIEWLYRLWQYKVAGKGLAAWFDSKYLSADGLIHPRFIVTGTSTGRLASSGPNFQNIPKRGFGKLVRRAIIPRERGLCLIEADYAQIELRRCLRNAGVVESFGDDAFNWLVRNGGGVFEQMVEHHPHFKKARDLAKSVSHAANYMEGIQILRPDDLGKKRIQDEVRYGARVVEKDWEYGGGVVSFTGANLAERFFGDKSWENRKKALEIQEAYFGRFGVIRDWQRKVSQQVEKGWIRSETGRMVELYGDVPEDNLKFACAFLGQGESADHIQAVMLRYAEQGKIPLIQVHDSLCFEVPGDWPDDRVYHFFDPMREGTERLDRFTCPVKVVRGVNWLDTREVNG